MVSQTIARRASKSLALNTRTVITAAVIILTVAFITAIVLQSDFFMYLCATLALMGVYALDRITMKGGDK